MRRLPLILIVLIGVMTPLGATLLYYFAPPQTNVAQGEVLPPQTVPEQWGLNAGKWTLLYASGEEACPPACQKRLCQMRQLRLMLPGHYFRLQRAWLRPDGADKTPLIETSIDCGEARAAEYAADAPAANVSEGVLSVRGDMTDLPSPTPPHRRADYLYLIDPDGVIAMRFSPALDAYAIRKDLAKLLKIAKGRRREGVN